MRRPYSLPLVASLTVVVLLLAACSGISVPDIDATVGAAVKGTQAAQAGETSTVDFEHIRKHYYVSHPSVNPAGIVPAGPDVDYDAPHDRERLPGAFPG